MVLDNRNIVVKLNKRRYISLLLFLVAMGVLVLPDVLDDVIFGINKSTLIIEVVLIYVGYIVFAYLLNYYFFRYSDEGSKLVFRFVSLRPFDNRKQAIEVLKKDFRGFKINKYFFNLREDLILRVETKKGVASYPPISITALSKKQKSLLIQSLKQFS